MRKNKLTGLSDKTSDFILVAMCTVIMLVVAYPLYYVLVASVSDPYDVYAGKTFLLPSQFTEKSASRSVWIIRSPSTDSGIPM